MGLFTRLKIGFGMALRSARVLREYPKLLLFPIFGAVSGIAFVVTLFGSLFLTGPLLQEPGAALYGALFVAYLVETFVASFFTAALVAATRTAFHGDEPSIRGALATAWSRKWPLLAWSLVAAIVGVLIQAIESQENLVAQLLAGLFAVAWSVMTYFVMPVIVFRDPSVSEMFSESATTFKDTWGESIGAMGAVNVVTMITTLVGVALGGLTYVVAPVGGTVRIAATVVVGGSVVLCGMLIGKSLTGVAKTALYVYATERTAPEQFEDMDFSRLGGDDGASTPTGTGRI